jgi:hypothetical protein
MHRRTRRIGIWLALLASGATLFQTVGFTDLNGAFQGGCRPWTANGVTSAVDMCYLLDCQNGFFGGLVDPCDPQKPALLDCPTTGTTTSSGNTTGTGGTGGA